MELGRPPLVWQSVVAYGKTQVLNSNSTPRVKETLVLKFDKTGPLLVCNLLICISIFTIHELNNLTQLVNIISRVQYSLINQLQNTYK